MTKKQNSLSVLVLKCQVSGKTEVRDCYIRGIKYYWA